MGVVEAEKPLAKPRTYTPKLSAKQRKEFLEAVSTGASLEVAAKGIGKSRRYLQDLRSIDEEFAAQVEQAQGQSLAVYIERLEKIAKGDLDCSTQQLTALFGVLKARDPSTWLEKRQMELTGKDGGALQIDHPDVSQAIERFTSTVVRLATRGAAERAALEAERPNEGSAGLRLAELASAAESEASGG